jgi:hypothetical protein
MSSIDKSIVSSIQADIESIDYGAPDLNLVFKNLDSETKNKILKLKKEFQVDILKSISNPEIQELWMTLPSETKTKFDSFGIRDKYRFLKKIINEKKEKEKEILKEKENKIIKTDSPNFPPPAHLLKSSKKEAIQPHSPDFPVPAHLLKSSEKEAIQPHTPDFPLPPQISENEYKEAPGEIFEEDEELEVPKEKKDMNEKETSQTKFNNLVKLFYSMNPHYSTGTNHELEVKFGTRGIKPLTRNDYDNVIKKLKSLGFTTDNSTGNYYLRINCEFLDSITGRVKLSDVRTEISGIHNIQNYCKNNDLKSIYTSNTTSVSFIHKKPAFINKQKIYPVEFDDFNFRVSYQTEENVKTGIKNFIVDNWRKSKKEFRYINRVSFEHPDFPVVIDISIVKYGNRGTDKFGREGKGQMIRVYTVNESNVFNNQEVYELEIEINNKKIGPLTTFNTPTLILESLRKAIKFVLAGLQSTNFPISYREQNEILKSYMTLIWKDEIDLNRNIDNRYFIGPNSITLQLINIAPFDENSTEPNITKDFVVTDKADGDRHLLYVSKDGKIYLINTNMEIIFTGAKTNNDKCFNTLIDGELILHNKNGKFINLYAAFDIYYFNKLDVRNLTFMLLKEEKDIHKSRYYLLRSFISELKPLSILDTGAPVDKSTKALLERYKKGESIASPIRITSKEFYPMNSKDTIFNGCDQILKKEREGRFEYTTDGLIFTHAFYGVGSNEIGKAGPKNKITWTQSFKWKPPQYNTIDFLVTTEKEANGNDVVNPIFEDGLNTDSAVQFNEYKTIVLRCGFNEKKDGYINPCLDIIEDKLPQYTTRFEDKQENSYVPKRFYPTEPYDPNAGLCKIMLKLDDSGSKQMFSEENEVFSDNTIVEFRYDFQREEGWRWVPLRVRYDKTARYLKGEKEYGNSYKTCNENWKSIHPSGRINEDMLSTGLGIPDINICEDKYYNTPSGKFLTQSMKNFHNLYVKKKLITGVAKQGDTLIDLACGKAGDLPKWINAKLSFVFGVDYSADNIENRLDGACARFLNAKKNNKNMPFALFVNGNSSYNIKDGSAMLNDRAKQITSAVFGIGPKESEKIGKGVSRQYGVGEDGFNISSCQFAIHYFLQSPDTLKGFMKNLTQCTKLNGYFIGTAYDGKLIFNLLKKTKTNDSIQIIENGKKLWEITKNYGSDIFDDDSSSIGYKINVFQESINQFISEYLINFDYLDRILFAFGFKLITREEAIDMGLPEGTGLFSTLYSNMLEEIKMNKFKAKDYGDAENMTAYEKKISFLNRYFVYKKFMEVDPEKVEIELGEYEETEIRRDASETKHAVSIAKEEQAKIKPKIRKLSKKLLLVPATEAFDEKIVSPIIVEKELKKSKKVKTKKEKEEKEETKKPSAKKRLIIENDEE